MKNAKDAAGRAAAGAGAVGKYVWGSCNQPMQLTHPQLERSGTLDFVTQMNLGCFQART